MKRRMRRKRIYKKRTQSTTYMTTDQAPQAINAISSSATPSPISENNVLLTPLLPQASDFSSDSTSEAVDNQVIIKENGSVKRNGPGQIKVINRVSEIIGWIRDGELNDDLCRHIQAHYKVGYRTALSYRHKALTLLNGGLFELPDDIATAVYIERLNHVYKQSVKDKKYRDSISAVSEAAKLKGLSKEQTNQPIAIQVNFKDSTGSVIDI